MLGSLSNCIIQDATIPNRPTLTAVLLSVLLCLVFCCLFLTVNCFSPFQSKRLKMCLDCFLTISCQRMKQCGQSVSVKIFFWRTFCVDVKGKGNDFIDHSELSVNIYVLWSIYMCTSSFRVSGSRLENAKYHGVVTDNIFDTSWSISVDEKATKKWVLNTLLAVLHIPWLLHG